MRKVLESCPSCGGEIEVREIGCVRCETVVRARYRPCDFCRLNEEQSTFLRLFVTSRGNLSELEKRLGISYPTVRAKLDEVIGVLGSEEMARERPAAQTPSGRRAILDAVARGELTPAEAAARLREIGGAS